MSLSRLIYQSVPKVQNSDDIEAILDLSKRNNQRLAISGSLFFTSEYFVQILEGDQKSVSRCFQRISGDSRHDSIELRYFDRINERRFPDWGMNYVAHSKQNLDLIRKYLPANVFDPNVLSNDALLSVALAYPEKRK